MVYLYLYIFLIYRWIMGMYTDEQKPMYTSATSVLVFVPSSAGLLSLLTSGICVSKLSLPDEEKEEDAKSGTPPLVSQSGRIRPLGFSPSKVVQETDSDRKRGALK